ANANGVTGTYGHHSDSFSIYNVKAAYDTLEFSDIVDDSVYAIVRSTITPTDSARAWYQNDNFFDFEPNLRFVKGPNGSRLLSSPYPSDGGAGYISDAKALKGSNRLDVDYERLAEATMTFNGTSTATFHLVDIEGDASYTYIYTIDLDTGAIARKN